MLYGLDLFSGIGGIGLGLKQWVQTIAYCERDRYAQSVLISRMESGELHRAPIWDDVQTLTGSMLPPIDIIFGGFPCQDISVAGAGAGLEGKRSGLFYEIIRLTKEANPAFVFLENVPAIRTRGLREVIRAFTEIGYDCRWTCLSAASIGALHKRERWFLLAHTDSNRSEKNLPLQTGDERESLFTGRHGQIQSFSNSDGAKLRIESGRRYGKSWKEASEFGFDGSPQSLAHAYVRRCKQRHQEIRRISKLNKESDKFRSDRWHTEPNVGRVADGVPFRVDRIKCLGNSVVPLQVETAFKILMGIK